MKELGGKAGVLVGLDMHLVGEEIKQGSDPHTGQLSESEEKHLRLRVKELICGSLNAVGIRQSLPQTYTPGTGHRSPGRHRGWELEFRDRGAIPGRGLLLTAERWMEGM